MNLTLVEEWSDQAYCQVCQTAQDEVDENHIVFLFLWQKQRKEEVDGTHWNVAEAWSSLADGANNADGERNMDDEGGVDCLCRTYTVEEQDNPSG